MDRPVLPTLAMSSAQSLRLGGARDRPDVGDRFLQSRFGHAQRAGGQSPRIGKAYDAGLCRSRFDGGATTARFGSLFAAAYTPR